MSLNLGMDGTGPQIAIQYPDGFVIALGGCVKSLTDRAIAAAEKIGPVSVDMGDTACKTPNAAEYLRKIQQRGSIGKKRKTARC